jgi:hypothetical protein
MTTKEIIINNEPIDINLHVIMVISNPCNFKRRYQLATEFITRMLKEKNVILYIVELTYSNQNFIITDENNKNHLRLHTETAPLWHKENMINLGVQKLLPVDWKAFAWIDADIEFENPLWALDALKVLNGSYDIIQLFSHCIDMTKEKHIIKIYNSFGFQYTKGNKHNVPNDDNNYWHPGYAWAMTRQGYELIGGLYEYNILGSGDNTIALSLINNAKLSINNIVNFDYIKSVLLFQEKIKILKLGYIPGVIRHYYHGNKLNRKYVSRWNILVKYKFNPLTYVSKDENGIIIPTKECPVNMLKSIFNYFLERHEDE